MSTAANVNAASEVAPWHAMSVDEVVKRLATDIGKGLAANEAATRLQEYGPNRLPEGKRRGAVTPGLSQVEKHLVSVVPGACLLFGLVRALPVSPGTYHLSYASDLYTSV